jgi:hypothetical protein
MQAITYYLLYLKISGTKRQNTNPKSHVIFLGTLTPDTVPKWVYHHSPFGTAISQSIWDCNTESLGGLPTVGAGGTAM